MSVFLKTINVGTSATVGGIDDILKQIDKNIQESEEAWLIPVVMQIGIDQQEFAPFRSGDLRDSPLLAPRSEMKLGIVRWGVPYAALRKLKNNLHPETVNYDIKTWEAHVEDYEAIALKIIEKDILK